MALQVLANISSDSVSSRLRGSSNNSNSNNLINYDVLHW